MQGETRQIVAFGGGGFSMEPGNTLLDELEPPTPLSIVEWREARVRRR